MTAADPARGGALLSLGTGGLLAVAAARSVAALPPWRWFDADPLMAPGALEGLGPAASLLLDLLLCLSAAAVLAGIRRRGGGIDPLLLLLWMLPLPWLWWHGRDDLEQAWRGGTLAASWLGLVAAAHLRQSPGHRLLLAAGLLACAAPWLLRGVSQWFIEHPAMVAQFDAERPRILAAFGWEEGGEAALQYERRLRQREAVGSFGLANVFSSLLAAAAVGWAALAVGTRGRHLGGGTAALAAAVAAAAAAGVLLNGSKGAIAALLCGAIFAAAGWRRSMAAPQASLAGPGSPPLLSPRWVLLAVPLGIGAIALRGVLPEGFLGERSLLFRWHYLIGALRVVASVPLEGVGPAGFQEWYLLAKPARSPEAVQSAHSLPLDQLAAVGLVAVAWLLLPLRVLWPRVSEPHAAEASGSAAAAVVYLGVFAGAATAMAIASPASLASGSLWPWVGVGLLPIAALVARSILVAMPAAGASWLLAAMAFTLLLHGQVEMTFFNQGSLPWSLLVVGLAGGALGRRGGLARGRAAAVLPVVLSLLLLAGPIRDAWEAERSLGRAALPLGEISPKADAALRPPSLPEVLAARRVAADRLAALAASANRAASHAAALEVEQRLAIAAATADRAETSAALAEALAAAEESLRRFGPSAKRLADRAGVLAAWRRVQPGEVPPEVLLEALQQAISRQPGDPLRWIELGDAHLAAGDGEAAAWAWRRAIEADDARELDPLVQLPAAARRALLARLQAVE